MTGHGYPGGFISDSNKKGMFVQKVSKWVNCSDVAYLATACLAMPLLPDFYSTNGPF